jgi:exodeoxyribonuclease-3
MKVITWNVNGLRSVTQKGFADFWKEQNPDLLCLQETKCHQEQVEDGICLPGWTGNWAAARKAGYSGTATFSRQAPTEVDFGFGIPKFDTEGRMVVTRFPEFLLFNVYFPNGGASEERHHFKQEFLKRFGAYLHRLVRGGEKVMVLGDFNVAYMEIDVYDPERLSTKSGFLPEERRWMENFLEGGFIDCYRYFYPKEEGRYTWWAYYENAKAGNRGWRIDHVCVSRNLEKHLRSATILDNQGGSDHCPVVVELEF